MHGHHLGWSHRKSVEEYASFDVEPSPRPSDRFGTSWIALVIAGALAPLAAVLAAGRTLSWRDTERIHVALRPLVVDALRDLRLPLWNPYEGLGMPLFAQLMHGVLHPVSVVAALAAPRAGMDAFIVFSVALSAAGAALLARALGVSRPAAAVAGLGFGLSGYVLGAAGNLVYLTASATVPWTVAALRHAAARAGPGAIALAAAAVAALHFAGEPQWTIVGVALGAVLALEAAGARGLGRAAAAVAIGSALAAVQLLPAWALVRETARAAGLDRTERTQWALSPWRLVELVSPGFFAGRPGVSPDAPVFAWLGGATTHGQARPFSPSIHVGAALLALAAAGAGAGRLGRTLAIACAALLWIALGPLAGADQVLHHLPVWGSFRYAEKLVGPLTLCLALLAALGCDRLASAARARSAAVTGAAAASLAIAAVALFAWPGFEDLFAGPIARAGAAEARRSLSAGLLHPALALAALAALLAWRRSGAVGRRFGTAAAALVFAEALAAAPFALHAGVRGVRDEAPLRALADGGEPVRIVTPTEHVPYPARPGLDDADRVLDVASRTGVAPYAVPSRIDQLSVYTALAGRRLEDVGGAFASRLGPGAWIAFRRYAVTHAIVTDVDDPHARAAVVGGTLVRADADRGIRAYAVPHRPWASFAPAVVTVPDGRAALAAVLEAERRGDPTVFVEGARLAAAPGTVLAVERGTERLRVEAESAGPATLVVNDASWPGWTATLDGERVPIVRADALVRAVAWPPGRHVLEMRYEPPEARAGVAASGAVTVALAVLAALQIGRRRRATAHPGGGDDH
jgi:hypothetical protein